MNTRVCAQCGKEYVFHGLGSGDHTKFCSDECFSITRKVKSLQNYYRNCREKQKARYHADEKRANWLKNSVPDGFTYLNDWEPGKTDASFRCNKHGIIVKRNLKALMMQPSGSIRCPECRREMLSGDKHRIHQGNLVDKNITIKALYKRDSGICYLCGGMCDWSDRRPRRDGGVSCGGNYPSIDHIIPLSKNGLHSWGNVKLAHLGCNMKKSNKVFSILNQNGGTHES